MAGIYLHIPFCRQACHYCDFHFSTNLRFKKDLVSALCQELVLQKDYLNNEPINTIYFGGGTPSLLDPEEFEMIFETIYQHYDVKTQEITVEANPEDLTLLKLRDLHNMGVNRLSIGIQSFNDAVLKFLNRNHTGTEAIEAMDNARKIGFGNISIDLIYAIPGQPTSEWERNISQAIALNPEHISSYSMTVERKTVFGNWLKKGKLESVSDDIAASELEVLVERLTTAGYEQYEVSNFCKAEFHSRHNSSYWKRSRYLGVGPSAHSYNLESRQYNVKSNALYVQSIFKGFVPFELETLTKADRVNEYLLTTLRTSWGCNLAFLNEQYNYDITSLHAEYLQSLLKQGYARLDGGIISLTTKGKLIADKIASDLFL